MNSAYLEACGGSSGHLGFLYYSTYYYTLYPFIPVGYSVVGMVYVQGWGASSVLLLGVYIILALWGNILS